MIDEQNVKAFAQVLLEGLDEMGVYFREPDEDGQIRVDDFIDLRELARFALRAMDMAGLLVNQQEDQP